MIPPIPAVVTPLPVVEDLVDSGGCDVARVRSAGTGSADPRLPGGLWVHPVRGLSREEYYESVRRLRARWISADNRQESEDQPREKIMLITVSKTYRKGPGWDTFPKPLPEPTPPGEAGPPPVVSPPIYIPVVPTHPIVIPPPLGIWGRMIEADASYLYTDRRDLRPQVPTHPIYIQSFRRTRCSASRDRQQPARRSTGGHATDLSAAGSDCASAAHGRAPDLFPDRAGQ
jgi:hypothetical protein